MKRVISVATIVCLAFSLFGMPAMAFAEGTATIHPVSQLVQTSSSTGSDNGTDASSLLPLNQGALQISTQAADDVAQRASGGVVDISLTTHISARKGDNLSAYISHTGTGEYDSFTTRPVTLQRKDTAAGTIDEYYARISDVDAGDHVLVISGQGYQAFEQAISINDGDRLVVSLIDTTINEKTYLQNLGMGLVPYGDYDLDGQVSTDDAGQITDVLDAIENGTRATDDEIEKYDLDGENGIDLADLQIITMNIARSEAATTRLTKDPAQMLTDVSNSVLAPGCDITDLFIDNGTITQIMPSDTDAGISEDNPVEFSVTPPSNTEMAGLSIVVPTDSDGRPTAGDVLIELEDGTEQKISFDEPVETSRNILRYSARMTVRSASLRAAAAQADEVDGIGAKYDTLNGVITVNFGNQIAVKKVTIRITATSSNKLAEIAQVEFLNGMEDKIPEPDLNIPGNIKAEAGDKTFTVTWGVENNISGYQVEVSDATTKLVFPTVDRLTPTLKVDNLNGKKLVNGTEYSVRIRSVSESDGWYSPWSNPIKVVPKATSAPKDAPEITGIVEGFTDLTISWKEAEDAESYNLFWWAEGDEANTVTVNNLTGTRYVISGLISGKRYYVQMQSANELGVSPKGSVHSGVTKTAEIKVPWYNLINREAQANTTGQSFDSAIDTVTYSTANDDANNPDFKQNSVVDGDYGTYYLSNHMGSYPEGPIITFKEAHDISSFALTTYLGSGYASGFMEFEVFFTNSSGERIAYNTSNGLTAAAVSGATNTYMYKVPTVRDVKTVQIRYKRFVWPNWMPVTYAEVAFYEAAPFVDDINGLWSDDLHTTLNDYVDQAMIDRLREQLNTPDPDTITADNPDGELHPDYERLARELDNAEIVLAHGDLRTPITVDSSIDKSVNNYGGGTNAWQPLGVSVKAGDKISIYVGANDNTTATTGTNTALRLYVCQQHPTSSNPVATLSSSLRTGLNEIDVSGGYTTEAVEDGGALYVEYISSTKNRVYNVRVEGGTQIPRLELHGITDPETRYQMCLDYVNELETHVAGLKAYHDEHHTDATDGAYGSGTSCTANMTDIGLDYIMYSFPASQVWAALSGSDNAEKARNLEIACQGGDQTMLLFYQHKGLSNLAKASGDTKNYGNNGLPKSRQNVRYTQMFPGAFMYAAGNHIGIEWGSVSGPIGIPGLTTDENGYWEAGRLFGWGLNHEIGHEVNQAQYTYAEVTNNYYAQLSQSHDDDATTRWGNYSVVYDRVTSGTKGAAGGKTGIAMYWQLHLAYDGFDYLEKTGNPSGNYKMYDNYTDLFNNLIFARIDSYARNPSLAPKPGGVALSVNGDRDNNIIRLACAAAEKDLRGYFIAWGLTPDAVTDAYASQFPVEERGIQYISDDLRTYQMSNYSSKPSSAPQAVGSVTAQNTYGQNTVNISWTGGPSTGDIWGYEILRNGQICGFVKADQGTSFTDTINTVNNRVYTYQVKVVDKWMNRSEAVSADAIKVHHENNLAKDKWSVTSDLLESTDDVTITDEDRENVLDWGSTVDTGSSDVTACEALPAKEKLGINKAIDGDNSTIFNGSVSSGSASLTIDFGESLELSALRYIPGSSNAMSNYTIEISNDNENWETIRTGTFDMVGGSAMVYFDEGGAENRLLIYDACYLRITAPGQSSVSIAEIDVLGPTGDDVEILENGIGYLQNDTTVGTNSAGEPEIIPKGSFVVTGTYKGNPAYNVVVLYDNDKLLFDSARPQLDAIIEGSQIIFAPEPAEDEMLPDVRQGYWVYYITPTEMNSLNWNGLPKNVSAELYRVDDAITLEGQRQVANTLGMAVPSSLPWVNLEFGMPAAASLLSDIGIQDAANAINEHLDNLNSTSTRPEEDIPDFDEPESEEPKE